MLRVKRALNGNYMKTNLPSEIIYRFSNREDGNLSFKWATDKQEALENRRKFLEKLGVNLEDCVCMSILDSDQVVEVNKDMKGFGMSDVSQAVKADAIFTKEFDVGLLLLTGDCLPIVLFDPVARVLALAHLSWKSTEAKLLSRVIEKMQAHNSKPSDVVVYIGPGIHGGSYKFENPIQKNLPGWESFLEDLPDGQTAVDIVGYNTKQLIDSGISKENIEVCPIDTATDQNMFSHYRSVRTGEPEGRFVTVAMMT